MCTVTLLPLEGHRNGFVLTSNRDELSKRETLPPEVYIEKGIRFLYPKDTIGGGSWIGISENHRVICLLNGGFFNHVRKETYKMSRGVVLKELLAADDFEEAVEGFHLDNIEPFTIILVDWKNHLRFFELVWDGEQKHLKPLELKEHLWSSSPLYNKEMKKQRENWFFNFLRKKKTTPEDLWEFHHSGGIGDKTVDIIMDRGFIKTQSITQVINFENETVMKYEDLQKKKITTKKLI